MAFIRGQITKEDKRIIEILGWDLERVIDDESGQSMVDVYIDNDIVDILTGPNFDTGEPPESVDVGDEVLWLDPDSGIGTGLYKVTAINGDVYILAAVDDVDVDVEATLEELRK